MYDATRQILAAEGWLDLGDLHQAIDELQGIDPEVWTEPRARRLLVRLEVAMATAWMKIAAAQAQAAADRSKLRGLFGCSTMETNTSQCTAIGTWRT